MPRAGDPFDIILRYYSSQIVSRVESESVSFSFPVAPRNFTIDIKERLGMRERERERERADISTRNYARLKEAGLIPQWRFRGSLRGSRTSPSEKRLLILPSRFLGRAALAGACDKGEA